MKPTDEQIDILDVAKNEECHIQAIARAGCGKTSILKLLADDNPWKVFEFVVFNRANAYATNKDKNKPKNLNGSTFHSMCMRALKSESRNRFELDDGKTHRIIRKLDGRLNSYSKRLGAFEKIKVKEDFGEMVRLVSLIKNYSLEINLSDSLELASRYGISSAQMPIEEFVSIAITAIAESDKEQGKGDWDDVIRYYAERELYDKVRCDFFAVDESQDNPMIRNFIISQFARNCRVIIVGDDFQAVYAWAGAESDSLHKAYEMLENCKRMPLTTNFRCDKSIIKQAQTIVPDIQAMDSKPDGIFEADFSVEDYYKEFKPGDVAIARTNRVLIAQCFKYLKNGKKATIQGADFADKLKGTIESFKATDPKDFLDKLRMWYEAICQNTDDNPSEAASEKYECLRWLASGCLTMEQIDNRIEAIFSDVRDDNSFKFCSAHRSKGLEWPRVFVLEHSKFSLTNPKIPKIVAEQEPNLKYIAYTRAQNGLYLVG